jgi:DNA-binding NarL/FixJ family response regulator
MNTAVLTRPVDTDLIVDLTSAATSEALYAHPSHSILNKLSPMELRVARLVADGLTNRQIGELLFVSHRTIDTHLSHVFSKLNVTSRVRGALVVGA